jgi:TIR domain-containing protein
LAELDPWGPISQLLFQLIDSDEIQDIVSLTGAPVDWVLDEREIYSNTTRVRAFRQRIHLAYNKLPENKRLLFAEIVANEFLTRRPSFVDELHSKLKKIGWRLSEDSLIPLEREEDEGTATVLRRTTQRDTALDYELLRLEGYFRDPIVGDGLMRPDMSSEACRNIRIALHFLGYEISENDRYDKELEKTVLAFQIDNNHRALDGYVGRGTRNLLARKLIEASGERPFGAMKHPGGKAFPTLFLSYAHEDIEPALRLFTDLRQSGVNVWFDKESLIAGQRWSDAIRSAIKGSRYFVALLSSNSVNKKGYVQKELKDALAVLEEYPQSAVFLIPARLDDCRTSDYRLDELHWVDMFPNWEEGLAKILRAIATEI